MTDAGLEDGVEAAAVPWRVVLLAAGGTTLLPGQRLQLRRWPTEHGLVQATLATRFQDVGLPEPLPRELVIEVDCDAHDAEQAVRRAAAVGGDVRVLLAFAVNAGIDRAAPYVAFESAPGLERRRFWQGHVALETALHVNRRLHEHLLFPVLAAVLTAPEREHIIRALGQYDVALHHWTLPARPLAMGHLFIAVEALGAPTERAERARLHLPDRRAHAEYRGIDTTQRKEHWEPLLLTHVRREVICGGDAETFDTARWARNKFQHAEEDFASIRDAAGRTSEALMSYVRRGVLALLDLPDAVREELATKAPLDVSPLQFAVHGELTGAVQDPDQLGYDGLPYPFADWEFTIDRHERLPDGRARITPRINLTTWVAEGVSLTWIAHTSAAGLTDPDLLDVQPSAEEPIVIRRSDPTS